MVATISLAACGGGGGSSPAPAPSSTPTTLPAIASATATSTLSLSATATTTTLASLGGVVTSLSFPGTVSPASLTVNAASGSATSTLARARKVQATASLDGGPFLYQIDLTPSTTVSLSAGPGVTFDLSGWLGGQTQAVALLAAVAPTFYVVVGEVGGPTTAAGPLTISGTTVTYNGPAGALTLNQGTQYRIGLRIGAPSLMSPAPASSPSPTASANPSPAPSATASPAPSVAPSAAAAPQTLYVVDSGNVFTYTLPFSTTPGQKPAVTLPTSGGNYIAADALGDVAVSNINTSNPADSINLYAAPLSTSSTPRLSVSLPGTTYNHVHGLAFDPQGDLFASSQNTETVYVWKAPITNGMAPSATITGFTSVSDITVDTLGTLYVLDAVPTSTGAYSDYPIVAEYAPPYTGGASARLQGNSGSPYYGLAVSNGTVYVGTGYACSPIGAIAPATSTPAFTFGQCGGGPMVADAAGDIYVASNVNNTPAITGYYAPISASTTAGLSLGSTNGLSYPGSLAIGK